MIAASGMPCTLPDGELSGVFISPCASSQIRPTRFDCLRKCPRDARRGADGNRVIAAKNQRNHILIERFADDFGDVLAGSGDFFEVLRILLAVVLLFRLPHSNVADVFHLAAELLQPRLQAGHAQGRRPHIHAAAAGAEVHWHTDDANFFSHYAREIQDAGDGTR